MASEFTKPLQTAKRHYVREILISTLATSLAVASDGVLSILLSFPTQLNAALHSIVGFGTALAAATSIEHFRIFRFLPFITKLPPSGVKAINDAVNIEAAIDYKRKALDEPSAKTSRTYSSGGGLEILVPIAICLASSFTTRVILGLSLEIGAFIAGVLVAKHISVDMGTLRTVFGGVLFASIGTIVNPRFLLANSHLVFLALVAVYSLKLLSGCVVLGICRATTVLKAKSLPPAFASSSFGGASYSIFQRHTVYLSSVLTGIGELSLVFLGQVADERIRKRRCF
mmetsp:Transcript_19723/g.32544  ORF Transcript_19723/g.32544 Transcript_19723/m.32544 type:complete len:285 (-) Transcript_19723:544-1398(-)